MPASILYSPMHSPPHYSHFDLHHPFHGSSPLSSPTSAISCNSCSSSPSSVAAADDDLPPDPPFSLCFGDIPVNSFVSSPGLPHNPASPHLRGTSVVPETSCSAKSHEHTVLGRLPSNLGARGSSLFNTDGEELKISGSEGISVSIPSLNAASCCGAPGGFCSNSGCMVDSPVLPEAIMALQKFLPSNTGADEEEMWPAESWPALDVYSCDDFRMFEFKVRKCVRGRSHDWTECPFAHPGEKARRRDPRRFHYSGTACPDFRKGNCRRGEACEYAHGVFECWLHPARYRTQPCKDGRNCRRRVCFFAHTPEQLRVVPEEGESPLATPGSGSGSGGSLGGAARSSLLNAAALSGGAYDGSPLRRALAGTTDRTVALEHLLDETSCKSAAAHYRRYHHHWFGAATSPSSTALVGLTAMTSLSPMSSPVLAPASPPPSSVSTWPVIPGHRRHLDRLKSFPTISIPALEDACVSPGHGSPCTMAELMSTLHHLQLSSNGMSVQSCRTIPSSNAWPLLSHLKHPPSQSAPSTPKSRDFCLINLSQISPAEPADIKGSPYSVKPAAASNEIISAVDTDAPDLAWVNDLIQ